MAAHQRASVSSHHGSLSLPLLKFSYATSMSLQGKLLWTHIPRELDLSVSFSAPGGYLAASSQRTWQAFQVIQRGSVIENVSLPPLAAQVRDDRRRIEVHAISDAERDVLVLVKKPYLALRYRLGNGAVRRIQMHFASDGGFDETVKIFVEHGFPVQAKDSLDRPSRPSTAILIPAPQPSTFPLPSPPIPRQDEPYFGSQEFYPGTSLQGRLTDSPIPAAQAFVHTDPLDRATPSPFHKQPAIPARSYQASNTPYDHPIHSPGLGLVPQSYSPTMIRRPNSLAQELPRPTEGYVQDHVLSQSSYVGQNRVSNHGSGHSSLSAEHQTASFSGSAPLTASNLSQMLPPKRDLPFPRAASRNLDTPPPTSSLEPVKEAVVVPQAPASERGKPKRAPPARRATKPKAPAPRKTKAASVDVSFDKEPLPTAIEDAATVGQTLTPSTLAEASEPPRKRTRAATAVGKTAPIYASTGVQTTLTEADSVAEPAKRVGGATVVLDHSLVKSRSNLDPAAATTSAKEGCETVPGQAVPTASQTPANYQQPPATADQMPRPNNAEAAAPPLPEEWVQAITSLLQRHPVAPEPVSPCLRCDAPPKCNSTNTESPEIPEVTLGLDAYAAKPMAERRAMLNDWICALVLDENFATLCQDVNETWSTMLLK